MNTGDSIFVKNNIAQKSSSFTTGQEISTSQSKNPYKCGVMKVGDKVIVTYDEHQTKICKKSGGLNADILFCGGTTFYGESYISCINNHQNLTSQNGIQYLTKQFGEIISSPPQTPNDYCERHLIPKAFVYNPYSGGTTYYYGVPSFCCLDNYGDFWITCGARGSMLRLSQYASRSPYTTISGYENSIPVIDDCKYITEFIISTGEFTSPGYYDTIQEVYTSKSDCNYDFAPCDVDSKGNIWCGYATTIQIVNPKDTGTLSHTINTEYGLQIVDIHCDNANDWIYTTQIGWDSCNYPYYAHIVKYDRNTYTKISETTFSGSPSPVMWPQRIPFILPTTSHVYINWNVSNPLQTYTLLRLDLDLTKESYLQIKLDDAEIVGWQYAHKNVYLLTSKGRLYILNDVNGTTKSYIDFENNAFNQFPQAKRWCGLSFQPNTNNTVLYAAGKNVFYKLYLDYSMDYIVGSSESFGYSGDDIYPFPRTFVR